MGRASGLERHVCGHPCGRRGERTPIAPEILIALWLYATLEGVGSARAVARLTWEHDAYRWICGGVQVNYHTLADFRTAHEPIAKFRSAEIFVPQRGVKKEAEGVSPAKGW